MNETIRLLARRRSLAPANLTEPGPSAAELETLLTIASRVPDHGKLAPWRFIVFEGEARERAGRIALQIKLADDRGLAEAARSAELGAFFAGAAGRRGRLARRAACQNSRNGSRFCRPARSA